jgi:predicted MPP superfamily phosphohydrolase
MKHKQPALPDTTWLTAFSATPGYHILLCHHPEYFPRIPESIELVLSGHAHGGQWRLYNPFKRQWIGVFAPGQGLWPRWTKGVYEGRLVVSAGLSNTVSVPRLFNPTEIVYIETA